MGTPIDLVTFERTLQIASEMLESSETHTILATNPEKVVAAQKNPELLNALESASLVIPDGIGVVLAARLLGLGNSGRVPGADLMPELCALAASLDRSVFCYGAKPGVSAQAASLLTERIPNLRVAGTAHGFVKEREMDGLIGEINESGADILFVALGSPRQELWMQTYRDKLDVRICQGVGGTFDAICGNPKRAPRIVRAMYLEWLYRLCTQPKRLGRQSALPRFVGQTLRAAISNRGHSSRSASEKRGRSTGKWQS